ncbi:hypothetical protein F8178_04555 [Haloechinothrix sp. LS1_15]|nr:hypothetical protein [Haloechinothrix sp. LS1_15]
MEDPDGRINAVRRVNGIIRIVCGLFAAILAINIVLVAANANFGNPFAQFVSQWASGVSLGLDNLFLTRHHKLQIALNQGLAAILWLIIGVLLTTFLSRVVLPGPERPGRR